MFVQESSRKDKCGRPAGAERGTSGGEAAHRREVRRLAVKTEEVRACAAGRASSAAEGWKRHRIDASGSLVQSIRSVPCPSSLPGRENKCCSGREAGGAERRVRVRAATECIMSVV